jgi:hypothetical protein
MAPFEGGYPLRGQMQIQVIELIKSSNITTTHTYQFTGDLMELIGCDIPI